MATINGVCRTAKEKEQIRSVDDILPSDVMQHILSFDGFYHSKAVNKQWKHLCDMNEGNEMTRLYANIPSPSNNQAASTYIIHPKRTHLNAVEIERGYKGPMNIEDAFKKHNLKDGDTFLLHDETHLLYNNEGIDIYSSLNLIGLGTNSSIKLEDVKVIEDYCMETWHFP